MLKINYTSIAESPIHTGADESHGTTKLLRREKRQLLSPLKIQSFFKTELQRRESLVSILVLIYKSIPKELKSSNYGFYDAYASRVVSATQVRTKYQFLTNICKSCGIRNIASFNNDKVLFELNKFDDNEFLSTIRDEHQYLMLMLRFIIQNDDYTSLFENQQSPQDIVFKKNFEWIPFIGGNSIRGIIRRLVMSDFLKRIGINKIEFGVEKDMYHQLMTGGNITTSTAFEDIGLREKYIHLCPMIGLLGSAIGNMTIQGKMKVGGLRPKCLEHGNSDVSFWEMISRDFGTRLDSSKIESEVNIDLPDQPSKEKSSNQMKYEFEVFNTGTEFDSDLILTSEDDLKTSAFWHCIKLWKEFGFVGGNSARGYGKIDIQINIPDKSNELYLSHLSANKKEALEFFGVKRQKKVS